MTIIWQSQARRLLAPKEREFSAAVNASKCLTVDRKVDFAASFARSSLRRLSRAEVLAPYRGKARGCALDPESLRGRVQLLQGDLKCGCLLFGFQRSRNSFANRGHWRVSGP